MFWGTYVCVFFVHGCGWGYMGVYSLYMGVYMGVFMCTCGWGCMCTWVWVCMGVFADDMQGVGDVRGRIAEACTHQHHLHTLLPNHPTSLTCAHMCTLFVFPTHTCSPSQTHTEHTHTHTHMFTHRHTHSLTHTHTLSTQHSTVNTRTLATPICTAITFDNKFSPINCLHKQCISST